MSTAKYILKPNKSPTSGIPELIGISPEAKGLNLFFGCCLSACKSNRSFTIYIDDASRLKDTKANNN